jgi:hypothetical protein
VDIQTLTTFFGWCSLINGGLLVFISLWFMVAPDLVYRTQTTFFPMSRQTFSLVFYGFLGLFKIFFLVFNLVPYIALHLIS